jgi:hypothetical protein
MSKKGQPNAEKTKKSDKKSRKKYWRVFCIPRPDATKSHLVKITENLGKNGKNPEKGVK